MIVPQYWAEGRAQRRERGRQVTVRRFGWSDASQEEAQAIADERARTALERAWQGEATRQREPKVPYNGAAGVPIREEIVGRHGDAVITRNAYGARCLNTSNVLFADIDFESAPGGRFTLVIVLGIMALGVALGRMWGSWGLGALFGVLCLVGSASAVAAAHRVCIALAGGAERLARRRIARFIDRHPDWHLRIYRTPAGLRLLAMHRTFVADDPAVAECFQALHVDRLYARMCTNQMCFRARLSPKPWRIGIGEHLRPHPGVWPVKPEHLERRRQWIEAYEAAARGFASCRFLEAVGSRSTHAATREIQALHDAECRATERLPLA